MTGFSSISIINILSLCLTAACMNPLPVFTYNEYLLVYQHMQSCGWKHLDRYLPGDLAAFSVQLATLSVCSS